MNKTLALFMVVAFLLLTIPVPELMGAAPRGNGTLVGSIFNEDMRTPVRNAVVKLRNVETQKEYASDPTDTRGTYLIPGIEEGRYVMGVLSPNGSYNFHYSIMIKADALARLSVAMKPGGSPVRLEQGMSSDATKKPSFFKSPAGLLTLITAAEFTFFGLVLSEGEASPIID